ncbi:MAG: DNA-binding protein [Nevskiaceae bacterium]|nr:MAG: DNA-binding protein [Nevskiaceae bacterium]
MKRRAALCVLLTMAALLAASSGAAPRLSATEAARHIGEFATVCGDVASAHFAKTTRGAPTFLNLDAPYPQQIFTIVIWAEARMRFAAPPESLLGRHLCVTGTIRAYRDQPEIVVDQPAQISD